MTLIYFELQAAQSSGVLPLVQMEKMLLFTYFCFILMASIRLKRGASATMWLSACNNVLSFPHCMIILQVSMVL